MGKVIQTFLANSITATEAIVGLIERKVPKRELEEKENHSMSAVGRRKFFQFLSAFPDTGSGSSRYSSYLPITENKASD